MNAIGLLGLLYAGITTLRLIDIKKLIAYSSIGHMSLICVGLALPSLSDLQGGSVMMLAHVMASGGLFASMGFLYERTHTRILFYYGGLVYQLPC